MIRREREARPRPRRTREYRKKVLRRKFILFGCIVLLIGTMFVRHRSAKQAFSNGYFKTLEESMTWRKVFTEPQKYPENMLDALKKNPEILDFVVAYPTKEPKVQGGITKAEHEEKTPLFIQWDDRWGYLPYGDSVLGITGCAPTCLSMVIVSLTGDSTATPDFLAKKAMEKGAYVKEAGTAWSFLTEAVADYNIKVEQYGYLTQLEMEEMLDDGKKIILSMGPGDFTSSGHFIVVCGYTKKGFIVNDPFSKIRSKMEWNYDTISNQWAGIWVYGSK